MRNWLQKLALIRNYISIYIQQPIRHILFWGLRLHIGQVEHGMSRETMS